MNEQYDDPAADRLADPLAGLLRPARRDVDAAALVDASVALARDVTRRPRRRTPRRAVAIGLAALVVAVPTSAAAYQWTTHTGLFGNPAYTEDVDSSEVLDLCAPDFPATARTLAPERLPLPAGATTEETARTVVHSLTRDCRHGRGVLTQATGVSHTFEAYAWCSWVNTWLADPAQRAEAADALHYYANSDLARLTAGDDNVLRWNNRIADAARDGDAATVRREQQVNCAGSGWRP